MKHCLEYGCLFVESSLPECMVYNGNIKRLSTGFYLILLMYLGGLIAYMESTLLLAILILQHSVGQDPATSDVGGLGFKFVAQELNFASTFSATHFSIVGFQSSGSQPVTEAGDAEEVTEDYTVQRKHIQGQ